MFTNRSDQVKLMRSTATSNERSRVLSPMSQNPQIAEMLQGLCVITNIPISSFPNEAIGIGIGTEQNLVVERDAHFKDRF